MRLERIRTDAALASTLKHELIIFDCDGVLVDSEVLSCNCLIDMLRRHEIETDLDFVFEKFLGRSVRAVVDYYRKHGRKLPLDFPSELRDQVRHSFANSLRAIPDVARLLRGLGTSFCVASSSDLERIEFSLELTELADLFTGKMFSAQMVRRGKPAPDLFLHAAASMGVDPRNVLVIEDSVSGVEAGKTAGMTVWGFVGGTHYAGRDGAALLTSAGADRIFDRMGDFHHPREEARHGSVG
ncbi:MAG: HAD family hydrolase [Hyphomicrobiales bacterium]|nr:HAD family hydrolase [Hyphomicrobiales bacterium]